MAIDHRSHTPLYMQLAAFFRNQIESGQLRPGSALPSETRMTQEYGIGREAIRMAVSLLRSEGLVRTQRGHGSYVRDSVKRSTIELAAGSSAIARMPTRTERHNLGLDEGVPVLEIRDAEGETEVLPGDEVELTRPTKG
ncbi:GntR family transcriptional regulator [Micromonospora sp. DT229]|uniref:GntR family transcriptional regulator n=1 Tax=Micromonospora sp. DT229 TaxID=3393430 RepID=UPI003CFAFCF3